MRIFALPGGIKGSLMGFPALQAIVMKIKLCLMCPEMCLSSPAGVGAVSDVHLKGTNISIIL